MTKINGRYFKRCLDYNSIQIRNGVFSIHSWESQQSSGIYRNEKIDTGSDSLSMFLSRKDCAILSNFDSLDITKKENTLTAVSGVAKIRLQDASVVEQSPDIMTGTKSCNVPIDSLKKAAGFVDSKNINSSYSGILIGSKGLVGTDSSLLYRYNRESDEEKMISVTPDILKMMDKDTKYELYANDKYALLKADGEIIYSALLEMKSQDVFKVNPDLKGMLKLDPSELIRHLRIMASISTMMEISVMDSEHIKVKTAGMGTDEEESRRYEAVIPAETNIKRYAMAFYTSGLIKVFDAVEPNVITLNSSVIKLTNGPEFAICAGLRKDSNVNIELEEEHD
ncbi:MAG: hypothetical protein LKF48_07440 [Prevotella sp.]|jgi:hypothetical protein|nr:hypothetical protein [Prevotella sp.]MCH4182972.1 hypothetical protein [Prevotella sp.]